MPNKPNSTPGLWTLQSLIDPYAIAIVQGEQPGISTRPLSKTLIAEFPIRTISGTGSYQEQYANATLCAKARDLYAALEMILPDAIAYMERTLAESPAGIELARQALCEARGDQTPPEGFYCQNCSRNICDKQGDICAVCRAALAKARGKQTDAK